ESDQKITPHPIFALLLSCTTAFLRTDGYLSHIPAPSSSRCPGRVCCPGIGGRQGYARPVGTAAAERISTWAPLRSPVFRALWIAQLVSNLGTWMQTVGAQWILVDQPNAAALVSFVQTALALPVMLLSIPSGVLADLVDRRRLLIGAQTGMALASLTLTVFTATGHTTPAVLLTLLFLLGCGQALTAPA